MIQGTRTLLPRCGVAAHASALVVLLACGSLLFVASRLEPSHQRLGTHQQLGLPACGFLTTTSLPCATCGMTTAFAYAARGDLANALITQPIGAVLAVASAAAVLVSGYALFVGLSLVPLASALWRPRPVLLVAGLIVASWVYKIVIFHASS